MAKGLKGAKVGKWHPATVDVLWLGSVKHPVFTVLIDYGDKSVELGLDVDTALRLSASLRDVVDLYYGCALEKDI